MITIHTQSHVGADGVMNLNIPVGIRDADLDVVVILQPKAEPFGSGDLDEWRSFMRRSAGAWEGEPLARPDQGEFEIREGLA